MINNLLLVLQKYNYKYVQKQEMEDVKYFCSFHDSKLIESPSFVNEMLCIL